MSSWFADVVTVTAIFLFLIWSLIAVFVFFAEISSNVGFLTHVSCPPFPHIIPTLYYCTNYIYKFELDLENA